MPYTQIWEVIDSKGTIHSGNEEEMKLAFSAMTCHGYPALQEWYGLSKTAAKEALKKYATSWDGDLKLIQVHEITA